MVNILLNDWPGWLALMLSFLIIIKSQRLWKDKHLTYALCFVISMHHLTALINTYLFTFRGADADAARFNHLATVWAINGKLAFSIGPELYQQLLGIFYRIFAPSHLFGEELSILVFLFSCLVLIKLLQLIDLERYRIPIILVYGLLPANLVICSVTLRESYQMLFFMLSVYYGIKYRFASNIRYFMFCIFSALLMALFHKALILYAFFLLILFFLWTLKKNPEDKTKKSIFLRKGFIFAGVIFLIILGTMVISDLFDIKGFEVIRSVFSGETLEYAARYREKLLYVWGSGARANYGIMLNISSIGAFIKSGSLIYFYYLFAPFPWQITNWLDVYAFVESLLRLIFIIFSVNFYYHAKGYQRDIGGLLLIIYFSMTLLWAFGTMNYGTSIRHHLLTNWIIFVLGGSVLLELINQQYKRHFKE